VHVLQLSLIRSTVTSSVRRPKGGGGAGRHPPLNPPLKSKVMLLDSWHANKHVYKRTCRSMIAVYPQNHKGAKKTKLETASNAKTLNRQQVNARFYRTTLYSRSRWYYHSGQSLSRQSRRTKGSVIIPDRCETFRVKYESCNNSLYKLALSPL